MAGLFGGNFDDPKTQGLLQLGLAMMQGSGPSPVRRPLASIIGEAGQSGIGAYQKARKLQQEEEDRKRAVQLQNLQLQQLMDAIKQREIMRQAGAEAYQSPLGEANEAAFAKTGLPLGRIENAAPQAEVMKTATGGFNPDLFLKSILSKGGDPLAAAQAAQAFRKATPEPVVVSEGGALVDRIRGKELYKNPKDKEKWDDAGFNERGQLIQVNRATGQKRAVGSPPVIGSINVGGQEKSYVKKFQEGMAERDMKLFEAAENGKKAIQMLDRLDEFVKTAPPTGGPIAPVEVWIRNFANEYGFPLDKVTDESNARLTVEFSSFLADQIISGGRGITDEDVRVISRSIPSFGTGIPRSQLPNFMRQLRRISEQKIANWNDRHRQLPKEFGEQYPASFGSRSIDTGRQSSKKPLSEMSLDELIEERKRLGGQ